MQNAAPQEACASSAASANAIANKVLSMNSLHALPPAKSGHAPARRPASDWTQGTEGGARGRALDDLSLLNSNASTYGGCACTTRAEIIDRSEGASATRSPPKEQ